MHHFKALPKPVSIEFHRPEHYYRGVTTKCVQAGAWGGGGAWGTSHNGLCWEAPPYRAQ